MDDWSSRRVVRRPFGMASRRHQITTIMNCIVAVMRVSSEMVANVVNAVMPGICLSHGQMNTVANMAKVLSFGRISPAAILHCAWSWQPVTWGSLHSQSSSMNWKLIVYFAFDRYFEFRICDNLAAKQDCLDKHLLKLAGGTPSMPQPNDLSTRFYPRNGSRIYDIKGKLPNGKRIEWFLGQFCQLLILDFPIFRIAQVLSVQTVFYNGATWLAIIGEHAKMERERLVVGHKKSSALVPT